MIKDLCFEVIQTCPNRCAFCSSNSSKDKKTIISFNVFKKTIDYFLEHGGIGELSISGGEPFLHPELFKMIRYSKEYNIKTVIFTSGIRKANCLSFQDIEYIKNKCKTDLEKIEKYEPFNERLKRNVLLYYKNLLNFNEFSSISRIEFEKLKRIRIG